MPSIGQICGYPDETYRDFLRPHGFVMVGQNCWCGYRTMIIPGIFGVMLLVGGLTMTIIIGEGTMLLAGIIELLIGVFLLSLAIYGCRFVSRRIEEEEREMRETNRPPVVPAGLPIGGSRGLYMNVAQNVAFQDQQPAQFVQMQNIIPPNQQYNPDGQNVSNQQYFPNPQYSPNRHNRQYSPTPQYSPNKEQMHNSMNLPHQQNPLPQCSEDPPEYSEGPPEYSERKVYPPM